MPRFRKKPVEIEAVRWWPGVDIEGVCEYQAGPNHPDQPRGTPLFAVIDTLKGKMQVSPGDWVIKGIKGELYPCKPDIFEATYETVEESA